MSNPNDYQSPSNEELLAMIEQIIKEAFADDDEWTVDKETAASDFPEEAN